MLKNLDAHGGFNPPLKITSQMRKLLNQLYAIIELIARGVREDWDCHHLYCIWVFSYL